MGNLPRQGGQHILFLGLSGPGCNAWTDLLWSEAFALPSHVQWGRKTGGDLPDLFLKEREFKKFSADLIGLPDVEVQNNIFLITRDWARQSDKPRMEECEAEASQKP